MEAEIIFESYKPTALRRALTYAGEDGFVASMPALVHARTNAPYDNILWNTWFTSYSEENVVTTPQGNHVVVVIHGGGIYASPERFEKMFYASTDHRSEHGYTGQFAGKISEQEARDALEGRLPDGTEVPVFSFEEFKQGIADLPIRYGVVLDYELARQSLSGYVEFEVLKDDPNMIVRTGGVEANAAYLDKFRDRHNTKLKAHWLRSRFPIELLKKRLTFNHLQIPDAIAFRTALSPLRSMRSLATDSRLRSLPKKRWRWV